MSFQNVLYIDITALFYFLYTLKCILKSLNNDRFEGVTLKNMILHTCTHLYMVLYMLIDLIYGCGAVRIDGFNL